MFAQTFSFWRRFVGRPAPELKRDNDERRLWVRYPADLKSSVQLAEHSGEDRVPAKVRDISRGGINLLITKSFMPGQLIDVELPAPDAPDRVVNVLACVVRSREEAGGQHSLGCVFSRELSDDDLYSFGARRVRHAPEDQRTWMRFPCEVDAKFQRIGDLDERLVEAQLLNISASGVGLEVAESVEMGALLNLQITSKHGHEHTVLACVVHSNHRGDRWQLGCNFIRELSEGDFRDLTD